MSRRSRKKLGLGLALGGLAAGALTGGLAAAPTAAAIKAGTAGSVGAKIAGGALAGAGGGAGLGQFAGSLFQKPEERPSIQAAAPTIPGPGAIQRRLGQFGPNQQIQPLKLAAASLQQLPPEVIPLAGPALLEATMLSSIQNPNMGAV